MGCKFCFHQEKFAYFWRSVSKRPKIFRAFYATNFFFAATTTFLDLKCYFLFLWPTNCSNLMRMNFHNFWCILGSARAKSLGGAYMPPPAWNKLYLRPRGIGLTYFSIHLFIHVACTIGWWIMTISFQTLKCENVLVTLILFIGFSINTYIIQWVTVSEEKEPHDTRAPMLDKWLDVFNKREETG